MKDRPNDGVCETVDIGGIVVKDDYDNLFMKNGSEMNV